PPPPPLPAPHWHWLTGIGWQAIVDGESPVQQGLQVALGAGRGRLALALDGSIGIPTTLADARTSVDLARHSVGLAVRVAAWRRPTLTAIVGVGAGVVAFARAKAVALAPDVTPSPAQVTAAALVSPAFDLCWRPLRGRPLWLDVAVAADVVAGAPE